MPESIYVLKNYIFLFELLKTSNKVYVNEVCGGELVIEIILQSGCPMYQFGIIGEPRGVPMRKFILSEFVG